MVKPVKQRSKGLLSFRVSPTSNLGVKKNLGSRVSLVPREARRLSKEGQEPVSPRVSCIGQIDYGIKRKRGVTLRKPKQASSVLAHAFAEQIKRRVSIRRKSDAFGAASTAPPSLRQRKQLAKGRSTLLGFDWRACNAEEKGRRRKRCYDESVWVSPKAAPSLQQMRQFGKGRSFSSSFGRRMYDAGEKVVKRKRN